MCNFNSVGSLSQAPAKAEPMDSAVSSVSTIIKKTKCGILILELFLITFFFNEKKESVIIHSRKMFKDILNVISSSKELLYNRGIQKLILNIRIQVKDAYETALMQCIRNKTQLFGLSKIILSFKDLSEEYLLYYGKNNASALVLSYANNCQYLFDKTNIFEVDLSFFNSVSRTTLLHALVIENKCDALNNLLHRIYRKRWINFKNHNMETPLHLACELNHIECIKVLLSFKETKINTKRKILSEIHSGLDETPLLTTCINNNTEVAKLLLTRSNIDINSCNYLSESALYFASKYNNTELIILLLKHKSCKLAEYTSNKITPFLYALKYNNKEVISFFLNHSKIKKYINVGANPIIYVLSEYLNELKYELIEYLFNYSFIDVNNTMSRIHPVNTALIECINQITPINSKIIDLLLSKQNISISYINYVNREGNTALKLACRKGLFDIVKRLLEFDGIDVSYVKTYDRTSALTEAIKGGHTEIVKLLNDYFHKI